MPYCGKLRVCGVYSINTQHVDGLAHGLRGCVGDYG